MTDTITIAISGPPKCGKSAIASIIANALRQAGLEPKLVNITEARDDMRLKSVLVRNPVVVISEPAL